MAIYEYKARIRYDEVDSKGNLTEMAMLNLFQNCSTFQSEDLGIGVEYLHKNHTAWVLSSWQMHIVKMPEFCEEITVQTWSCGIRKALGNRNYRILDSKGDTLCVADSLWAYIDTDTLNMVPAPKEQIELYGVSPALELPKMQRKILIPDDAREGESVEVKSYFIDTNNHVNNGKYVMIASEYIPDDFKTVDIRAEYKKSAVLGDIIKTKVFEETIPEGGRRITVSMTDEEGNVYSNVQFCEN